MMSSLILFEPSFYLLAAIVVLLPGMSKGGFAGGLGTLAVPLLTLAIDPRVAAAIMLPILVCMDFVSLATYRKYCDRAILMTLVPAAIVGIIIGTLTFQLMSAQFIRLIIGLLSLYIGGQFFVKRWRKTDLSKGSLPSPAPSPKKGRLWGCVSGFTSFVAHAGGPPLSIYLLPLRLDKSVMVGTSVVFFTLINAAKLIPYAWLGQLTNEHLLTSLVLLPLAPIGVRLGVYLHQRVTEDFFYWLSYSLLALVGIKLISESLLPLLYA